MSTRDNQLFDEQIRHKLEGYSEPPDMQLLQKIHAKKSRVLNWYGIARVLFIVSVAGLGLLGNHYYQHMLRTGIDPAVQLIVPVLNANVASEATQAASPQLLNSSGQSVVRSSSEEALQSAINPSVKSPEVLTKSIQSSTPSSTQRGNSKTEIKSELLVPHPSKQPENKLLPAQEVPKPENKNPDETKKKSEESTSCTSAFQYFKSFTGEFNFTNFSSGNSLKYAWDFGDGSRSAETSPSHQYRKDGHYTVQLTVSDNSGCTHSESRDIIIQSAKSRASVPSSIKGMVRAGNNPVGNAVVELIPTGNDAANAYTYTVRTNVSGEFTHKNIKAGHYILVAYATAETPLYNKTFWGNEQELSNAPEIVITSDQDDELNGYTIDLTYHGITTTNADHQQAADEHEVMLMDQNNNIVGKAMMDAKGNIHYDGQMNGSFKVIDIKTGNISGTVNMGNDPIGSHSGGSLALRSNVSSIGLSPNPASSSVNLNLQSIEGTVSRVTIMDANGKEMFSSGIDANQGFNNIPLDVSKLPGGNYYVIVMLSNGQVVSGRLVKSDNISLER